MSPSLRPFIIWILLAFPLMTLAQSPGAKSFEEKKRAYIKKYAWPKRPKAHDHEILFSKKSAPATQAPAASKPAPPATPPTAAPAPAAAPAENTGGANE